MKALRRLLLDVAALVPASAFGLICRFRGYLPRAEQPEGTTHAECNGTCLHTHPAVIETHAHK